MNFLSIRDFRETSFAFAFAKEFRRKDTQAKYNYELGKVEKFGRTLMRGVESVLDLTLREIKNPILIIALTALTLLVVTIVYYPQQAWLLVTTVVPFAKSIEAWMVKMALYILTQITVSGIGLRAFGRFSNPILCQAWRNNELEAVMLGDKRV